MPATGFDLRRLYPVAYWLIAVCAVAGTVYHVLALAWWGDDPFFSFAYARNLVRGAGLVYNVGERVEGYTNFLWTMMIAAGMKAGIDPMDFTKYAGAFFHACTVVLYSAAGWRIAAPGRKSSFVVPLTAVSLAVHHDFNEYGTSGLETAIYAFGVGLLYVLIAFGRSDRMLVFGGCAAAFIMFNRPDAVIFIAPSMLFIFLTRGRDWRPVVRFILPLIVLYVPYWLWRYSYYGMPFPNTFYAKSIASAYAGQGVRYATLFFQSYYVFLALPVLLVIALRRKTGPVSGITSVLNGTASLDDLHPRTGPLILGLMFVGAQIGFTIYIGGDFMFSRFFIMIIPIMYFLIELLLISYTPSVAAILFSVIVVAATLFRYDVFEGQVFTSMIADEPVYYKNVHYAEAREMAQKMHDAAAGTELRVAFGGALAAFVYFLDPAVGIDATTGLNDSTVAHQHLEQRGRPGHEKHAPLEYLNARHVQFYFDMGYTSVREKNEPIDPHTLGLNRFALFFGITTKILEYDTTLMKKLSVLPGAVFTPPEPFMDSLITRLPTMSESDVAAWHNILKTYYFDVNHDTIREKIFLSYMHPKQ